jgi:hypothetical protein
VQSKKYNVTTYNFEFFQTKKKLVDIANIQNGNSQNKYKINEYLSLSFVISLKLLSQLYLCNIFFVAN